MSRQPSSDASRYRTCGVAPTSLPADRHSTHCSLCSLLQDAARPARPNQTRLATPSVWIREMPTVDCQATHLRNTSGNSCYTERVRWDRQTSRCDSGGMGRFSTSSLLTRARQRPGLSRRQRPRAHSRTASRQTPSLGAAGVQAMRIVTPTSQKERVEGRTSAGCCNRAWQCMQSLQPGATDGPCLTLDSK